MTAPAEARFSGLWAEVKAMVRLSAPLIVGQISQVGIAFTDTVMAGRLGPADLAAVALGSSLWLPVLLFCIGVMMALSPTVSRLHGAGREAEIALWFRQGAWLALGLGALALPLVHELGAVMPWLGIDAAIIPLTGDYLAAVAWGLPGVCVFLACRYVSEGMGLTRAIMVIQLTGLAVNVVADYVFMFGKLGLPAMGAEGTGWATALVLWLNGIMMLAYLRRSARFRHLALFSGWRGPALAPVTRLLGLGLPIAVTMVLEMGLFSAVALLMGQLGPVAVAAHQVAINFAALAFMVPLGLSMGITVRVGHALGAGRWRQARFAGLVGMGLGTAVMTVSAAVMVLAPGSVVAIYTGDPPVMALAVQLLGMAAIFQLADGLQVTALGALRGIQDTTWPMAASMVAYWLVGLPLAWYLGLAQAYGPRGLWVGLVVGLFLAAVTLTLRFLWRSAPRALAARHG